MKLPTNSSPWKNPRARPLTLKGRISMSKAVLFMK